MERRALVAETLLAGAQRPKVLRRLWRYLCTKSTSESGALPSRHRAGVASIGVGHERIAARFDVCTGRYVCLVFHDDATDLSAADHHVEEDLRVGWIHFEWRRVAALHRPCG